MSTGRLFFAVCLACAIVGCKGSTDATPSTNTSASTEPSSSTASGVVASNSAESTTPGSAAHSTPATQVKSNGKTYSLVGKWVAANAPKGAKPPSITITKDQIITEISVPAPDKKGTMSQKNVNAYHVDGNKMTIKAVSITQKTDDVAAKANVDKFNTGAARALSKTKPVTVDLVWLDKDHFSFTTPAIPGPNGQTAPSRTLNFERKK